MAHLNFIFVCLEVLLNNRAGVYQFEERMVGERDHSGTYPCIIDGLVLPRLTLEHVIDADHTIFAENVHQLCVFMTIC